MTCDVPRPETTYSRARREVVEPIAAGQCVVKISVGQIAAVVVIVVVGQVIWRVWGTQMALAFLGLPILVMIALGVVNAYLSRRLLRVLAVMTPEQRERYFEDSDPEERLETERNLQRYLDS